MDSGCPVVAYDRAGEGYAEMVGEWISNPHAYFKAFGPEAREFQKRHRSERLRTMTLVAPAEELAGMKPLCVCLDGVSIEAKGWDQVFAQALPKLFAANVNAFDAMQRDGLLDWLGCLPDGEQISTLMDAGKLCPTFANLNEVVARIQWLFLMCGIRLNEVIVQVDPYTNEQWKERKAEIDRRRAEDKAFMEGRRAAQQAWAEDHPDEDVPEKPRKGHFL